MGRRHKDIEENPYEITFSVCIQDNLKNDPLELGYLNIFLLLELFNNTINNGKGKKVILIEFQMIRMILMNKYIDIVLI